MMLLGLLEEIVTMTEQVDWLKLSLTACPEQTDAWKHHDGGTLPPGMDVVRRPYR